MVYDLLSLIANNQPFPETDIETIPPEPFGLPANCTLASYLRLDSALAHIAGADSASLTGLLPGQERRYTVLRSASLAVIAAVSPGLGARDQVRPALEALIAPVAIDSPAALAKEVALVFTLDASLRLCAARRPVRFAFHWLRELSAGCVEGQLGEEIETAIEASVHAHASNRYLAAVALDEDGWLRLRIFRHRETGLELASSLHVEARAETPLDPSSEPLLLSILAAGAAAAAPAANALQIAGALARSIYEKTLPAIERKYTASLSWSYQNAARGTALIDCSFAATENGMAAYRNALEGDLRGLLEAPAADVQVRKAAFTEALDGHHTLELHLPFLDRKAWTTRWDALARAQVEAGEDGRLLVYTVKASDRIEQKNAYQSTLALAGSLLFPKQLPSFELTYSDTRTGEAGHLSRTLAPLVEAYGLPEEARQWLEAAGRGGGSLAASLTLSVPGSAVAAWLGAPGERDPNFFEVYSQMSVAVQQATRRWLPYVYFSEVERYADLASAYPLLLFQSTRPYSGRPRSDFTYDMVGPGSPGVARPWAARPLAAELTRVQQLLLAAGRKETARFYSSWRAPEILAGIAKNPRLLNALLTGDAFFVDRLVRRGVEARELAGTFATDPRKAVRKLVAFAADFAALFHRRLRRLYGGRDFVAFGSLLLVEATRALAGDTPVSAALRVSAAGREQTFVNAAYGRP